jgi:hypothetical protein
MKKIYSEYFQKSKVFLYPLLGIKKGVRFVPVQTYISWNNICPENMNKFLCLYNIDKKDETLKKQFEIFKKEHLEEHQLYEAHHIIDNLDLFIFDFSIYKKDLEKFKKGLYSEFSHYTKEIILNFFGKIGTISEYVESYLYPGYFYDIYAEILKVPVEDLHEVGQLCDKPDMTKEEFEKELVLLELFKY